MTTCAKPSLYPSKMSQAKARANRPQYLPRNLPVKFAAKMDSRSVTSTPAPAISGFLGLDRKAMEKERLARLGKRQQSSSPERPSKKPSVAPESRPRTAQVKETEATKPGVQFPNGAVKRTWAYKHPRTNDIKIEEVFQGAPNIAILSAFLWDDRWVFSKLPPEKTKQIWVMSAKGQDVQDKLLAEALDSRIPNFKPHFPPMQGNIQHMHSKLLLLFHESHLRIVVPTANMIKFDWGETNADAKGEAWQAAVMENSLFMIDLPRHADGEVGQITELPHFGHELVDFLKAQKLRDNVVEGVLKFDFSKTEKCGFVHSIPGEQSAQFSSRTGLPGLRTNLRKLGLDKVDMTTMELDYAASSLGSLKENFLRQLYQSAAGQSHSVPANFLERVRIYFPTYDTVRNSTGGPDCAGIISLNRSFYNNAEFPKQCMRDYKSTRPGVLSHNKIMLVRGRKTDGTPVAWAYVGSANLSESAWGSQRVLKAGGLGKLTLRNWECGVVVPVPAETMAKLKLADGQVPPIDVFKEVVEIPFEYPGEAYGNKKPWFFRDGI